MIQKILLVFLMIFFIAGTCMAQDIGYILSKTGNGKISCNRNNKKIQLGLNDKVRFGDEIETDSDVKAEILLTVYDDRPQIIMKPKSKIKIKVKNKPKKSSIFVRIGRLFFSGSGKSHHGFKIETYNSVAGIEGTKFEVEYLKDTKTTNLKVFEGKVKLQKKVKGKVISPILPGGKPLFLEAGEGASVKGFAMKKHYSVMKNKEIQTNILNWNQTAFDETTEDKENLVMDGEHKLNLRFLGKNLSRIPVAVQVYLNGYRKLNGEEMIFKSSDVRFVLKNLEEGDYTLKFVCCGYAFEKNVSIPIDNKLEEIKIEYALKTIKCGFKGIGILEQVELEKCYTKYSKVIINGIPVKLLNAKDNVSEIPEALRYTVTGRLYFYTPVNADSEIYPIPVIITYQGARELLSIWKDKKQISGNTIKFSIKENIDEYNGAFELK